MVRIRLQLSSLVAVTVRGTDPRYSHSRAVTKKRPYKSLTYLVYNPKPSPYMRLPENSSLPNSPPETRYNSRKLLLLPGHCAEPQAPGVDASQARREGTEAYCRGLNNRYQAAGSHVPYIVPNILYIYTHIMPTSGWGR